MENHALDPIIVLRVKTICCKECPEKLQKGLRKIEGVHQLSVDPEKNLVSVRGNVDPFMLVKAISKAGKSCELIYYDKEPKIEEDQHQHQHRNAPCSKQKHPSNDDHHNSNVRQNAREKHPYFCCHGDDHSDPPKMEEFNHEAREDRGFSKEDDDEEDIFKHSYFRFRRSASTNRKVPPRDNTDYQKQAHFRTQSSRYETWNPEYSRWWFSEQSPPYEHYSSRMPQQSYGPFRENRPMSQFYNPMAQYDNFAHYFSDYNTNGCSVM